MNTLKLLLVALVLSAGGARSQDWPTATPESQGMDSAALARLVDYGANAKMDSLVVVRNGKIVAEAYYAPYRREMLHRINSATKAFAGALAGIAIARGDLPPPETPVTALFPDAAPADARWKDVRLQHLLDMTSGVDWTEPLTEAAPLTAIEMERSPDWAQFVLQRRLVRAPGERFDYNSGNPHLVMAALARKAGMPVEAYAERHLFAPLGITQWRWRKDPQGVPNGGYGMYLHTRDMARFGQLYLQGGQWNGKQVLPREWVARVFSPKVEMDLPRFHYADFWWSLPHRKAYFAAGFHRQLIMVLPELGIVAAMTGRMHYPFEDVIGHLERAATGSAPLAADEAAQAVLRERIAAAAAPAAGAASAAQRPPFERAAWQLDDNPIGVREFALDFTGAKPMYFIRLRSRAFSGQMGLDGGYAEGNDNGAPVFTRARWKAADTLDVEQRWVEDGATLLYSMKFSGDELEITHTDMWGRRGVTRGRRATP